MKYKTSPLDCFDQTIPIQEINERVQDSTKGTRSPESPVGLRDWDHLGPQNSLIGLCLTKYGPDAIEPENDSDY